MRVCHLTVALVAAVLVAACDSKTPASPTPAPVTSGAASSAEYVLIVRALDADTKGPISGLDVTILDGPRAGNSSSSPSDQLPLSVPAGRVTLRVTASSHDPAETSVDVSGAALVEVPLKRSATPSPIPSPSPSPAPAPALIAVSGVVRDSATGRGIPNAVVDVLDGADSGRGATTDANGAYRIENLRDSARRMRAGAEGYAGVSFDVTGGATVNFDLMPISRFLYSGTIRDGRGQPVAGATIQSLGVTLATSDGSGRYEIQSPRNDLSVRVRPPSGYEPNPVQFSGTISLAPGARDITVRRIARVSIFPSATIGLSGGTDFAKVNVNVEFDTGQVESPYMDSFSMGSSDSSVVRGRVQDGFAYLEGIKVGTAEVWGVYFDVRSATSSVQVVTR